MPRFQISAAGEVLQITENSRFRGFSHDPTRTLHTVTTIFNAGAAPFSSIYHQARLLCRPSQQSPASRVVPKPPSCTADCRPLNPAVGDPYRGSHSRQPIRVSQASLREPLIVQPSAANLSKSAVLFTFTRHSPTRTQNTQDSSY